MNIRMLNSAISSEVLLKSLCVVAIIGVWIGVFSTYYFIQVKVLKRPPSTGGGGADGGFSLTTIITFLIVALAWKLFHLNVAPQIN
jgi:hypothetical protein